MAAQDTFNPKDCCGRFDPVPWENGDSQWEDRLFLKDRVRSFLHIPLNFTGVMKRSMALVEQHDACPESMMVLSDENSLWGADVYVSISKDIEGASTKRISGRMLTRVFEGPYRLCGQWAKQMK